MLLLKNSADFLIKKNNILAVDKLESLQEKLYDLPDVPYNSPPFGQLYSGKISNAEKIEKIHLYIEKLQYNHTGLF